MAALRPGPTRRKITIYGWSTSTSCVSSHRVKSLRRAACSHFTTALAPGRSACSGSRERHPTAAWENTAQCALTSGTP